MGRHKRRQTRARARARRRALELSYEPAADRDTLSRVSLEYQRRPRSHPLDVAQGILTGLVLSAFLWLVFAALVAVVFVSLSRLWT